jgi:response regulator of citrate/malate metabolism
MSENIVTPRFVSKFDIAEFNQQLQQEILKKETQNLSKDQQIKPILPEGIDKQQIDKLVENIRNPEITKSLNSESSIKKDKGNRGI